MLTLFFTSNTLFIVAFVFWTRPEQNVAIISGGIGLILLVATLIVAFAWVRKPKPIHDYETPAISPERREKAQSLYKQRVEEAIQRATGKRDEIAPNEAVTAIKYTGPLEEGICMVCKLFLQPGNDILQCPVCESLYHEDHLLEWISKKKKCPVCTQVLVEVIEE